MSASIAERIAYRQRRVEERLDRFNYPDDMSRPMMRGTNVRYELSDRDVGKACGGIGLIGQLVQRLELAKEINQGLSVFKIHLPYHESDHVLNLNLRHVVRRALLEGLGAASPRRRLPQLVGGRSHP